MVSESRPSARNYRAMRATSVKTPPGNTVDLLSDLEMPYARKRLRLPAPVKALASLFSIIHPFFGWRVPGNLRFGRHRDTFMQLNNDAVGSGASRFATGWDWWREIGSPKTVCAPMVDQSELPFRLLCREFGTDLTYTPMIHARLWKEMPAFRKTVFDLHASDRPCIAQLAGHDPDVVLTSAQQLADTGLADAIDLNFGCPQDIAKRGRYGAFLLEEPDTMVALVRKLATELSIPVTAKLRLLPSLQASIDLCKRLEEAGASALAVHGRTLKQKKQFSGAANWDAIRDIVAAVNIPVIANGGIETRKDVDACLNYTGCAAVMSSEALLENPALFCSNIHPTSGAYLDQDALTRRYLDICAEHAPVKGNAMMRGHLFKILHNGLRQHTDLRDDLLVAREPDELRTVFERLSKVGWDMPNFHHEDHTKERLDFSWYQRHAQSAAEQEARLQKKPLSREELIAATLEKHERKAKWNKERQKRRREGRAKAQAEKWAEKRARAKAKKKAERASFASEASP